MYTLCIIFIIIPSSSTGVERTFFNLRQIKNYTWNGMTYKRLTSTAVLKIEWSDISDKEYFLRTVHNRKDLLSVISCIYIIIITFEIFLYIVFLNFNLYY